MYPNRLLLLLQLILVSPVASGLPLTGPMTAPLTRDFHPSEHQLSHDALRHCTIARKGDNPCSDSLYAPRPWRVLNTFKAMNLRVHNVLADVHDAHLLGEPGNKDIVITHSLITLFIVTMLMLSIAFHDPASKLTPHASNVANRPKGVGCFQKLAPMKLPMYIRYLTLSLIFIVSAQWKARLIPAALLGLEESNIDLRPGARPMWLLLLHLSVTVLTIYLTVDKWNEDRKMSRSANAQQETKLGNQYVSGVVDDFRGSRAERVVLSLNVAAGLLHTRGYTHTFELIGG